MSLDQILVENEFQPFMYLVCPYLDVNSDLKKEGERKLKVHEMEFKMALLLILILTASSGASSN